MKLLFKQRLFSWFDSYDIFDESGNVVFTVKGQFSLGHCLKIYDANGNEVGTVKEKILSFLPRFEIYKGGQYQGSIKKEFTFFKPKFSIDFCGYTVDGDWFEWNYRIFDALGANVATVTKELWNFTDTYVLDIKLPENALNVLMLVLAIDAEKCSRND